ncbi:hypothetical protein COF68_05810 [Bacillus toyonensis]|uniref:hypothetical protein n=1 Tax=Bacillus toyonensis TaxID=155322 RepID=UPI000BFBC8AA|nr:hypothetical protein [Bacillus toyonensis]PHE64356.1 hypothetical protein COF68_05810 [Bacillus toyonensis]
MCNNDSLQQNDEFIHLPFQYIQTGKHDFGTIMVDGIAQFHFTSRIEGIIPKNHKDGLIRLSDINKDKEVYLALDKEHPIENLVTGVFLSRDLLLVATKEPDKKKEVYVFKAPFWLRERHGTTPKTTSRVIPDPRTTAHAPSHPRTTSSKLEPSTIGALFKWVCTCGHVNETFMSKWKRVQDGQGFADNCKGCGKEKEIDIVIKVE